MDILIVDDEPLARLRLARMLAEESEYRVVGEAGNSEQALQLTLQEDPDIVLMDIHMPGESGLQAAQALAQLEEPPAVIFCTAYDQHALEAFGVNAADYLVKPVRKEQLLVALVKACNLNRAQRQQLQAQSSREHISARTRKGIELIAIDSIHFFVADQKYVTVFHDAGETLIDETLKDLEEEFSKRFVRIHRNALVPVNRIVAMEKDPSGHFNLRLSGTDRRPQVSRRHAARIRELLSKL